MGRLIIPTINMVSKDGNKEAFVQRLPAGYGCDTSFYEITMLQRGSKDYPSRATSSFKEAIQTARQWTGRDRERDTGRGR